MSASTHVPDNDPDASAGVTEFQLGKNGLTQAGNEVRWIAASADLEFPPVPFPSRKVFAVAGEARLRMLVTRHCERLLDSSLGHLFPRDPQRFALGVERTADFVVEATGGPACYSPSSGRSCMRTLHFPFVIDERAREIWLAQFLLAFDDVGFPEEIRPEFWNWIEAMSIRMINRRTMRAQPARYPLADAPIKLSPFMKTRRPPIMCPR